MAAQTYKQYLDLDSGVIKRPEGPCWSDPYGDGVWRSSWFYASLLIIKEKDPLLFAGIKSAHGLD